jgi:predicted RNA-binding Zn-ribbon protein involved in translation (DUF1610 family)
MSNMRRGNFINLREQNNSLIDRFQEGDLVTPYYAPQSDFYGEVIRVNKVENKVYVDLSGTVRQFDPDEIRHVLYHIVNMNKTERSHTRRGSKMVQSLYYKQSPRVYKQTNQELENKEVWCPKCKTNMDKETFTKSKKIYRCPECGFKIHPEDIV